MWNQEQCSIADAYHYKAFGLRIGSDILLPELVPAIEPFGEPEVRVGLGKVPTGIPGASEKNDSYEVGRNEFLFRVPDVGKYYVTSGNRIIVEPDEQAPERFVRLFLLGTTFGSLLLQRGVLAFHGSAVVLNGFCVIFTGESGSGKSSLAAAFRKQGYPMLTDNVAALTLDNHGGVYVQPSYPRHKLLRDSAEAMGLEFLPESVSLRGEKFAVPVTKGFCNSPVRLGAICELRANESREVSIRRLSGGDKLAVVLNNTYRRWLIDGLGLTTQHFKRCLDMAGEIVVSRLTRPQGMFSLEEQMRLVQDDLRNLLPAGSGNTKHQRGDARNAGNQKDFA